MPLITYAGHIYRVSSNLPLLDSLLSEKAFVPYSCRSGYCHSCLMKAEQGKPPALSQKSLDQSQINQGYFLACQCLPDQDMEIALAKRKKIPAVIVGKTRLTSTLIALDIAPRHSVDYEPGQHITVWASETLARPCYLASTLASTLAPSAEQGQTLTIHIQRKANGEFSQWAHDCTQTGQKISISDVLGTNIYHIFSSIHLAVVQDGCLAPILALLRTVKEQLETLPHSIELYLQLDQMDNLYGLTLIQECQQKYQNFSFHIYSGLTGKQQLRQQLKNLNRSGQLVISGDLTFIKEYSQGIQMDILPLPYS